MPNRFSTFSSLDYILLGHSTYLQLPNFRLPPTYSYSRLCRRASTTSAQPTPRDEMEALFTDVLGTSHPMKPASSLPRGSMKSTAAEQEWLQEEQFHSSSSLPIHPSDPTPPTERFDWRLPASSRIRRVSVSSSERKKFVRRKIPPLLMVEKGHSFYNAIRSYEDR